MNDSSSLRGKTCAVIGLARSGIPSVRFLAEHGAHVLAYDNKTREQLPPEALELEKLDVTLITNGVHFEGIENAKLIVLSPGIKIHHEPFRSYLEQWRANGAEIIGELELAARFCPCPIIAVTSTKGKSTTVNLIANILHSCGVHAVPCGNTGSPLMGALPQLTPQSWVVLEVSSFQLESISTLKPRVAILLNLLEDHQDYHPSLRQYWETKLRLFSNQGAGDIAILNSDETRVMEHANYVPSAAKVLLTSSQQCHKCIVEVRDGVMGWDYENQFIPVIETAQIPLFGAHNRANVAAALAAIFAVRGEKVLLDAEKIGDIIRHFHSLPHRLEIVATDDNGVRWINDSQATIPDASAAALQSFDAPILLIAGGRAKLNAAAYARWGKEVANRAVYLLTIGDAKEMLAGVARQAGMPQERIVVSDDLPTAVANAAKLAPPHATIIMSPACTSFDQFKSYEDRGDQFRELAQQQVS